MAALCRTAAPLKSERHSSHACAVDGQFICPRSRVVDSIPSALDQSSRFNSFRAAPFNCGAKKAEKDAAIAAKREAEHAAKAAREAEEEARCAHAHARTTTRESEAGGCRRVSPLVFYQFR